MTAMRAGLAAAALLIVAACQQRIEPPPMPDDPAYVYIVDHGRHAGLVLPSADGSMTEWFWGDWHYFALRERSVFSGARALFDSPAATLGRLELGRPATERAIRRAAGARKMLRVRVSRAEAEALDARLAVRYAQNERTEVVHPDGSRFVREGRGYGITHNSNHKVCEWLIELGARARCGAITARFVLNR